MANRTAAVIPDDIAERLSDLEDEINLEVEYLLSESENEEYSPEEQDDFCQPQENNRSVDNPPVYVIPASDSIYKSNITRSEHLLAASAFATRHNLSDTALNDLLELIQLHLPENNLAETNSRTLKESCGFDSSYLEYHLYCDGCKKLFDTESELCSTPGCIGTKNDRQCKNYFVTGRVSIQLREILERAGVWKSIKEFESVEAENISDIVTGCEYKRLKEPGGFLYKTSNITLSLFVDGVPLFKSSSTSIWPVYLLINEIPRKERFNKKNMLLWGVWQGIGKPKMNMFLRPLVRDLLDLYQDGLTFICPDTQVQVTTKAMLIIATMDLQARAYVLMITHHNGENGCLYCMEPGTVVPSGNGHCRAYLSSLHPPEPRTDDSLKRNAELARQTGKTHAGIMGQSVLGFLPYFSFTKNVVIDYMHGTLLGVSKKLNQLWFDPGHSSETFSIYEEIKGVDEDLKNIKPPYVVHRLPRVITNTHSHWKASELRNWLLFYSLPCLKDRLPNVYIVHYSCLVEAIYILLREGISSQDLRRADQLLQTFVRNVQVLYGERFMSLNVHNLTHMVQFVKSWGPLWAWSCFAFESFNGEIKKSVHGTGNVCKQIFWTLQAQKHVESKARQLPAENSVKMYVQDVTENKRERFSLNSEAYQCRIVKISQCATTLNQEVKLQLKQIIDTDFENDFVNVSKVGRNGFIFYSQECTKVKKQNSYTIRLEKKLQNNPEVNTVEVQKYLMELKSKKVFAICRLATSCGSILPRRVPHLQQIVFQGYVILKY